MTTILDADGQPLIRAFNQARRIERDISELLGLAKGLLADGRIVPDEAALLNRWLLGHAEQASEWPLSQLAVRLTRIYDDGRVDDDECEDLRELLTDLVGGNAGLIGAADAATSFPIDHPPPPVVWPARCFVFTGKMAFGPRSACIRHVERVGGWCNDSISMETNYVVIGTFGSRDWVHTSFGRKIEKAVDYRTKGYPLAIITEDHWAAQLPEHASLGRVVVVNAPAR